MGGGYWWISPPDHGEARDRRKMSSFSFYLFVLLLSLLVGEGQTRFKYFLVVPIGLLNIT